MHSPEHFLEYSFQQVPSSTEFCLQMTRWLMSVSMRFFFARTISDTEKESWADKCKLCVQLESRQRGSFCWNMSGINPFCTSNTNKKLPKIRFTAFRWDVGVFQFATCFFEVYSVRWRLYENFTSRKSYGLILLY